MLRNSLISVAIVMAIGSDAFGQAKSTADQMKEAEQGAGMAVGSMLCIGGSIIAGLVVYFAPTLIGMMRGHANMAPILIVNFFFGWTMIGWVVALAWAFTAQDRRARYD